MAKGERKRRRQQLEENARALSGSDFVTSATPDGVPADERHAGSEQQQSGNPYQSSGDSPQSLLDSDSTGGPRPVALAEILAAPRTAPENPRQRTARPSFARPESEQQTAPETPEERTFTSGTRPTAEEASPQSHFVSEGEHLAAESQSILPNDETGSAGPQFATPGIATAPRASRRTNEPILVALLLVILVVLAFDTYFTLRLNGLSDRLSAVASRTTPAAPLALGERPWVGVDSVKTQSFANGGQPVTTVHIVNSGREPAYDLRSNTVGSLRSAATAAPDVPAQKGPLATTGLLLPNTGGNLTFFANTRALTADEAANVRSGQYVLWLAGRLDYKDAKGQAHATTFRYRYDPALNSFIAAPEGNLAN